MGGNDGIAGVAGGAIYNNTINWFYDSSYPGTQHPDGIQTEYAQHLKIYNNVFLNPGNSCMVIDPFSGSVTYIYIYNNQCYFNNYTVVDGWADEGIGIGSNGAAGLTISNIFMCNNLVIGGVDGVTLGDSITATFTNATVCNNIWTANTGGVISPSSSSTYTQVDNIQVSTTSNPGFVNYPQLSSGNSPIFPNFNLTSSATQFLQKGVNEYSVFTTDAAGRARPSSGSWDIGPYQYSASGGTTTSTVSSTSTTSASTTSTTSTASTSTAPTTSASTTIPPTTVHYVLITLTNGKTTATPTPFQQMISFNPSTYASYEAADLGNIRFYLGTDTLANEIRYWCESGCTSSSPSAVFWLRLPNGIAANSNLVVNMTFQAASVEYDGAYAGIAPQLTAPFGKYDNGAQVFNIYTNSNLFASSAVPSGWSVTTNCDGASSYYCIYYGTAQTAPLVLESYGKYIVGSDYIDFPILENSGATVYGGVGNNGGSSKHIHEGCKQLCHNACPCSLQRREHCK